jgi:regulator of replication initiation timing
MAKKCFRTNTKGLGGGCSPLGDYSEVINFVDSVSFETKVINGGSFNGCTYNFLVVNGISRYPDLSGGSAGGTGTITEITCPVNQSIKTYNCINGQCVEVVGESGDFATLELCQNSGCEIPKFSYNCINGQCVQLNNEDGAFKTLAECQTGCRDEKKCCVQNTEAISGLQQRVNKLESTTSVLKSEIDRIKSENKQKKLGNENSDLAQRVGRLENYINALDRELTTFKKQIEKLFKDVQDFGKFLIDFLKIILALFI